jgi:hypothetical protein
VRPQIPEDDVVQYGDLLGRLRRLEQGFSAMFSTQQYRVGAAGGVNRAWLQGGVVTTDGTTPMQLVVKPQYPSAFVASGRVLVDHSAAAWIRPDMGINCSPVDASGLSYALYWIGPGHHSAAGDYASAGGTRVYRLAAGTTYTFQVLMTYDGGTATWTYFGDPLHTYLDGLLVPLLS